MFAVCRRLRINHFFNSLDLSAPEEAYSRNVHASDTLKFRYECVFKIIASRLNKIPNYFLGGKRNFPFFMQSYESFVGT